MAEIYTSEQKKRRDESKWTLIQGILAPLQFLAFALSLACIIYYFTTGDGYWVATVSVLVKTGFLYAIMVTGAIWEKVVFGRYLFAPAFFWEDAVSMVVIALHTAYVIALIGSGLTPESLLWLAIAAYVAYVINAAQFLIKFSIGRSDASHSVTINHLSMEAGR